MKIDYRWIGLVVIALAVGHWSGRVIESGETKAADGVAGDSAGQEKSYRERSGARSSKRSNRNAGKGQKSRQKDLDRILSDFSGEDDEFDDPFAATTGMSLNKEHPSWARLCAWVMHAPRSDFPAIMDVAAFKSEGKLNQDVMELLIQRWVELDPDSALGWLTSQKNEDDAEFVLSNEMFLVQEAVMHHPQWASEALRGLYQKINSYNAVYDPKNLGNPFGDSGIAMDFDMFFWRLSSLPEAQRDTILNDLDGDIFEKGIDGWMRGVIAHGGEQDLAELYDQAVKSEHSYGFDRAFQQYAAKDWKAARAFVERHQAHSADEAVWKRWAMEDGEQANQWYIKRATDSYSRETRIANIANEFEDVDQQKAWVEQMENQGEPVTRAIVGLISDMNRGGRVDEAMALVSRLPQENQKSTMLVIYSSATENGWFKTVDNKSANYRIPQKKYARFYKEHPSFQEYLSQANEEALQKLGELMRSMESNFENISDDEEPMEENP